MKSLYAAVVAAMLSLTAACSSSSSSDRYIDAPKPAADSGGAATGQTGTQPPPSPSQAEQSAQASDSSSPLPSASQGTSATPSSSPAADSKPSDKKTVKQKVQEAKKENESVGKAVTDSILDKSNENADSKGKTKNDAQLKTAVDGIRDLVKDLKQHAENGDTAKIVDTSAAIRKAWDGMKADVKASFPDMTDFLQQKIDKLAELEKAETIDAEAILQLDYEMYQAFRQLADKANG